LFIQAFNKQDELLHILQNGSLVCQRCGNTPQKAKTCAQLQLDVATSHRRKLGQFQYLSLHPKNGAIKLLFYHALNNNLAKGYSENWNKIGIDGGKPR
jgi:hypothetical protein